MKQEFIIKEQMYDGYAIRQTFTDRMDYVDALVGYYEDGWRRVEDGPFHTVIAEPLSWEVDE